VLLARAAVPAPFVLVGHSFGGLVTRIFAQRYRADVAALVLVDPAHPEDWITPAPKEQVKIDRGVRMCRLGARLARFGVAKLVSALAGAGALQTARRIVRLASRGVVRADDEGIMAPMHKLPAETRRHLHRFWTRAAFFEALGSQIETISISARETEEAAQLTDPALPVVTISHTNPSAYRQRQQDALAARFTGGRHVVANDSGHWIPLDDPAFVIDVILGVVQAVRARRDISSVTSATP
jgi:pimeloyl-ACP methyl ester carboxylesterase